MKLHVLSGILVAAAAATLVQARSASPETIRNLNAAYQGESNASHRYARFAEVADREGLAQAAKLFRAAARAEAIHRDTHRATIVELEGAVDDFGLDAVSPGTTAENLKAAVEGESYERDTMYPGFLATARADNARPAVRSLQFALAAEREHARLYQEMLDSPDAQSAGYYVCTVCGFTTPARPDGKCPSCRSPSEKFVSVD